MIQLNDTDERPRASMLVKADDSAKLTLLNKARNSGFALGFSAEGEPGFVIADGGGQERIGIGVKRDGAPGILINDAQGNRRVGIEVDRDGKPAVKLLDARGNMLGTGAPR